MPIEPHYQVGRPLGNGGFGVVYEAKMITGAQQQNQAATRADGSTSSSVPNQLVAIKEIPPKKVDLESKRLVREVDILGMLSVAPCHPCVLRLLDAYVNMQGHDGFSVNLVMPLYHGDLHQFAKEIHRAAHLEKSIQNYNNNNNNNNNQGPPPQAPQPGFSLKYVSEVARVLAFKTIAGLAYIHSCHLVHRDMKPENVMITIDRSNPYNSQAVVGDFGLARAVSPTETFYTCTRQYRPPEVVTNTAKGNSSMDLWSTGCVFYELVTGVHLFQVPSARDRENNWVPALASQQLEAMLDVFGTPSVQDIPHIAGSNVQTYLQKTRPRPSEVRNRFEREFKLICSPQDKENWFNLINSCLQFVPDRRSTAEQLIRHDLFTSAGLFVTSPNDVEQIPQHVLQNARFVIDAPAPRVYRGGSTRDDIRSNKETILALVRRIHEHMFPPFEDGMQENTGNNNADENGNNNNNFDGGEGGNDGDDGSALVFPNPTTIRVGQWFGNVEAVLSDPEGALDGALEAIRMTDDLTPAEKMDLENIAKFCKARLDEERNLAQD
jgi:serine/threonine protein kinase